MNFPTIAIKFAFDRPPARGIVVAADMVPRLCIRSITAVEISPIDCKPRSICPASVNARLSIAYSFSASARSWRFKSRPLVTAVTAPTRIIPQMMIDRIGRERHTVREAAELPAACAGWPDVDCIWWLLIASIGIGL